MEVGGGGGYITFGVVVGVRLLVAYLTSFTIVDATSSSKSFGLDPFNI